MLSVVVLSVVILSVVALLGKLNSYSLQQASLSCYMCKYFNDLPKIVYVTMILTFLSLSIALFLK
jgi:hypothetical protein